VLGDFEWSFLAVTSQSYSADVMGFRLMTSECISVVPMRHTSSSALALLTSHVWLSSTAGQLRQVQMNNTNVAYMYVDQPFSRERLILSFSFF